MEEEWWEEENGEEEETGGRGRGGSGLEDSYIGATRLMSWCRV